MMTTDERPDRSIDVQTADDPTPLAGLTGFKLNLLFVLSRLEGTNPSGQEVKSALDGHYATEVKHGRFYQNLSDLVNDGYVTKTPLDGRTNAYRLTPQAYEELAAHHRWQAECLSERTADA